MKLFDRIKNIVFVSDEEEYESETAEEIKQPARETVEEPIYTTKKEVAPKLIKSKTANYSENSSMHLILERPTRFDDVTSIADKLNVGKAIVINLEETPKDIQRRIVDFLCGAAYAHGGAMKKVSKYIFIVAARGVDVTGELLGDDFDDDRIYF